MHVDIILRSEFSTVAIKDGTDKIPQSTSIFQESQNGKGRTQKDSYYQTLQNSLKMLSISKCRSAWMM